MFVNQEMEVRSPFKFLLNEKCDRLRIYYLIKSAIAVLLIKKCQSDRTHFKP
ncbi:MAG: hypothetical protein U7127_22415 [Phormidium sp.]